MSAKRLVVVNKSGELKIVEVLRAEDGPVLEDSPSGVSCNYRPRPRWLVGTGLVVAACGIAAWIGGPGPPPPPPPTYLQKASLEEQWPEDARKGAKVPLPERRYAFLIGVQSYPGGRNLRFTISDVRGLEKALLAANFPETQICRFDSEQPDLWQPTKRNIENCLEQLVRIVTERDVLIVAFSGHGIGLEGRSYLCPSDVSWDDPRTMISVEWVYSLLGQSAAKWKVLIVDACRDEPRSGQKGADADGKGFMDFLLAPRTKGKEGGGIALLTSCGQKETSREASELKHGVFVNFVLEGLNGPADINTDGVISLTELYQYAWPKTKDYVEKHHPDSQFPGLTGTIHGDLAICAAPRRLAMLRNPFHEDIFKR